VHSRLLSGEYQTAPSSGPGRAGKDGPLERGERDADADERTVADGAFAATAVGCLVRAATLVSEQGARAGRDLLFPGRTAGGAALPSPEPGRAGARGKSDRNLESESCCATNPRSDRCAGRLQSVLPQPHFFQTGWHDPSAIYPQAADGTRCRTSSRGSTQRH